MGSVPTKSSVAVAVHSEADPCPPPEPVLVAFDRFDRDLSLDAGDLPEQFCDARCLQPALRVQLHMLEIAAPAASRSGMWAGRIDPVGRDIEDLDGIRPQVGARLSGDTGPHPLSREGVADEDHLAVGSPAHAAATPCDRADLELEELVVAPGRHASKRTAANLAKISSSGCRFGAGPIVVGATTNPNSRKRRIHAIPVADCR
jgi:hypothetical protein